MYQKMKQKIEILQSRKPFSAEAGNYIEEMNRNDWIYSCLHLDGSDLSRESLEKITRGEFLVDVPLSEHEKVHRYAEAVKRVNDMVEMSYDLTESGMEKLFQCVYEENLNYRKNDPVLRQWNYNPPHFNEIKEQMTLLYLWLYGAESPENPILRACLLHFKLLEIYPFGSQTEDIARFAMLYELICAGFPPIGIPMSEQEYNRSMMHYIKTEEIQEFYHAIERAIYNKIEVMLQLTEERF